MRMAGIEPTSPTWKEGSKPLTYTRTNLDLPRRTARRSPDYKTSASLTMLWELVPQVGFEPTKTVSKTDGLSISLLRFGCGNGYRAHRAWLMRPCCALAPPRYLGAQSRYRAPYALDVNQPLYF